ncbi:MAG: carbohydrate kinase family protein [Promethearchaeia archaeon]
MNTINKPISITFAGHFAVDNIIRFNVENEPTLGGSVTYCSLALSNYTNDVEIHIISCIGKNNFNNSFLDILKKQNINLKGITWYDTNNTNFVLRYSDHSRTLILRSKSPDLSIKNIPKEYLKEPPDAFVFVPICNEIPFDFVESIVNLFPKSYIGMDLQGFIRKIDDNGNVLMEREEKMLENINKIIDITGDKLILKGSEEEMKLISGKTNLDEVMEYFNAVRFKGISIMTLGENGSMITRRGEKLLKIPAFRPKKVEDETGAGDAYLAIFMYEFLKSDKLWDSIAQAGLFASAAASFLVEEKGPYGFKSKEQILERIRNKKYIF